MTPDQVDSFSRIFKALSNPHRLKILMELAHCPQGNETFTASVEEMENCQQMFARHLGLAPSTISHHFKELRMAGLVKVRREGKNLIVQVDREVLASVRQWF